MNKREQVVDIMVKLSVFLLAISASVWLASSARNNNAVRALNAQSNEIRAVVEKLKKLENQEVNDILGVK